MVPNVELHIMMIHLEPPKRVQPLYKGQNAMVPKCPFYGGSNVIYCMSLLSHTLTKSKLMIKQDKSLSMKNVFVFATVRFILPKFLQ